MSLQLLVSQNKCVYRMPIGILRMEQCGVGIEEGKDFCNFHLSLDKQKKVDKWLHCIRPKQEHSHLNLKQIPKEEYPEYLDWYEDHTPYQSDEDD